MSVHKKLQEARVKLQSMKLTKSGNNKFAGYDYFELGDFIPQVNTIFNELGLCGMISYSADLATLTITDSDSGYITFTCPMAMASLKGCHEIQNLGASMTYIRRYLWVNALEIVEHDALDATTMGNDAPKSVPKSVWDTLTPDQQAELQSVADTVRSLLDTDMALAIGCLHDVTDADAKVALWSRFDSKERAAIKAYKPLKETL